MKFRIYYDSTATGGRVYHTEYIKFCEHARSEIFFQNNIFFENEGYVVKEIKASYIGSAKLGDIIEVKITNLQIKKASLKIKQEIFKDKKKIFEAETTLAYLENGKLAKIPSHHLKILNELKIQR